MAAIVMSRPVELWSSTQPDAVINTPSSPPGSIIDIGGSNLSTTMKFWLEEKLFQMHGNQLRKPDNTLQHLLPSPLLSSDNGLALWREINRLPDYYQTDDEIELLKMYGQAIARYIPDGASIIDLGSGDIRKVKPLLEILESNKKKVCYYALDLSRHSLEMGMREIRQQFKWVQCYALWGLFNEGLEWIDNIRSPRLICSLGSSLGNDWTGPAIAHLRRWVNVMEPGDRMLLGMDSCKDHRILWQSYHDDNGLFEKFIRYGMEQTNIVMNDAWYRPEDWDVSGIFHEQPFMHQFAITANKDVLCKSTGIEFKRGTQIDCYEAFKYDHEEMQTQFGSSGLHLLDNWESPSNRIRQYLLAPASE